MSIVPHGGELIDRFAKSHERERFIERAPSLPAIRLNPRKVSDLEMIAMGALSPLQGFMQLKEYVSVLDLLRLPNGLPWTIPITLSTTREESSRYREGNDVALYDRNDHLLSILHLERGKISVR